MLILNLKRQYSKRNCDRKPCAKAIVVCCFEGFLCLVPVLFLFFPLYRTARGDNVGTALSFVTANDYKILKQAEEELTKEFTGTGNIMISLSYQIISHSTNVFCLKSLHHFRFKKCIKL